VCLRKSITRSLYKYPLLIFQRDIFNIKISTHGTLIGNYIWVKGNYFETNKLPYEEMVTRINPKIGLPAS